MKKKIITLAALALTAATLPAQTLTTLYNFFGDEGSPIGGLALSTNVLYGITGDVMFSINTNGTDYSVLNNFVDQGVIVSPRGNLVLANDALYGTSTAGGGYGYGSVFSINTDGSSLNVLHSFTNTLNGSWPEPYGSLVLFGNRLYGTTFYGGDDAGDGVGYGTIFSINTNGDDFAELHEFTGGLGGAYPAGGVIVAGDTLYGTASQGGSTNAGIVFSMNIDGSNFAVLHDFTNSPDGASPLSGLILSSDTLYGTTSAGGDDGSGLFVGTVYSLNIDGSSYKTLSSFSITNADWDLPGTVGNLLLSGNTLYGAVFDYAGSEYGSGVIYSLYTDGSAFTVLHRFSFADADSHGTNDDGAILWANNLVMSGHTLYGTTSAGGTNGFGTVFALDFQAPPPVIKNIVYNGSASNSVTISCLGGVGWTYYMQATTNLAASPIPWVTISTNIPDTNGFWLVTDSLTNGGFFSFTQTNLVYSDGGGITPPDPGQSSTNLIGTNVTVNSYQLRFYRAATVPAN